MTVRRVNLFTNEGYVPFQNCNIVLTMRIERGDPEDGDVYYNHVLIDTFGTLMFHDRPKTRINILALAGLEPEKVSHSFELVCADLSTERASNGSFILITIWIELSPRSLPVKYHFVSYFLSDDAEIQLYFKLPPEPKSDQLAHCRAIKLGNPAAGVSFRHFCLTFMTDISISEFPSSVLVGLQGESTCYTETVMSLFPEISFDNIPGVVIRSDFYQDDHHRLWAFGLDSGYALVCCYDVKTNTMSRFHARFVGPVCVATILPQMNNSMTHEKYVLFSSTLGPAQVWRCNIETGSLQATRICKLDKSNAFDIVTSACLMGDLVAIGTYKGFVLFYKIWSITKCDGTLSNNVVALDSQHEMTSSVISMKALTDKKACILTSHGLYSISRSIEIYR